MDIESQAKQSLIAAGASWPEIEEMLMTHKLLKRVSVEPTCIASSEERERPPEATGEEMSQE